MNAEEGMPRAAAHGKGKALPLCLPCGAPGLVPADATPVVRKVAAWLGPLALLTLRAEQATTLTCAPDHVAVLVEPRGSLVVDGPRGGELPLPENSDVLLLVVPRARLAGFIPVGGAACFRFGEPGSGWPALIRYALEAARDAGLAERLEATLLAEIGRNWPASEAEVPAAVPRHVRVAEAFLRAKAAQAPSIAEAARAAGVSERALSEGFRRFLGITPGAYLRELRLQGVRTALEAPDGSPSVAQVAMRWSYSNFGVFARAYAHRFGELPSVTLRRVREASTRS